MDQINEIDDSIHIIYRAYYNSLFANCRSQLLLDHLGRCLKLVVGPSTDSTSCHEFASQFGLAIFYTRKTPKNSRQPSKHSRGRRECLFESTSDRPRKGALTASRLGGSDPSNSDNRTVTAVCVHVRMRARVCVCM